MPAERLSAILNMQAKDANAKDESQKDEAMGVTLRATTLIVATAVVTTVVTLSSAADAHDRYGYRYGRAIRWCTGPSPAFGLPYFFPCGRARYYYSYYSGR